MNSETVDAYKNFLVAVLKNMEKIDDPAMDEAIFLCKVSACVVNACASIVACDNDDYKIFTEAVSMEAEEGANYYFKEKSKAASV